MHTRIYFATFIAGFVVMVLELSGTRLMGPVLGTSVYVWTSIIGVILAALSAGYSWGGRLADRGASVEQLSMLFLYSSLAVGVTPLLGIRFTMFAEHASLDPRLLSTLSAVVIFALPSVFLGMISPYSARLVLTALERSGATVGNVYALSTIGSILGTFLAGFFLFSLLGVQTVLLSLGAVLALTALFLAPRHEPIKKLLWLGGLLLFYLFGRVVSSALAERGVFDLDTNYQRVIVVSMKQQDGSTIRSLVTDGLGVQGQMVLERPEEILFPYLRSFDVGFHFVPSPTRALMLGGGTFTYPLHLLRRPNALLVDVVEIDPGVTGAAKQYFSLTEHPRLRIIHEDARTFVNRSVEAPYDLVFIDTFNAAPAIPFQLTTKEFVQSLEKRMSQEGAALVNIIASFEGESSALLRAMTATYRSVFPHVLLFRTTDAPPGEPQNVQLVALKRHEPPVLASEAPETQKLLDRHRPFPPSDDLVLSDDFAPVESLSLPVAIETRAAMRRPKPPANTPASPPP